MDRQSELWFNRQFEELYRQIPDPWGCAAGEESLNNNLFLELLVSHRPVYQTALDIGCGLGGFTDRVRRYTGARMIGIDVAETAVKQARAAHPRTQFLAMNIMTENLSWTGWEGAMDLVIMSEVLWYVCDFLDEVLLKIQMLLTDNGVFAVHQFFPEPQAFYAEYVNGLEGFRKCMSSDWEQTGMVVNYGSAGPVLLGLYQRR